MKQLSPEMNSTNPAFGKGHLNPNMLLDVNSANDGELRTPSRLPSR